MKIIAKTGLFCTALCILFTFPSCEKEGSTNLQVDPGDPVNIALEVYQKEVVDSANRFAFDLFASIVTGANESDNIMISPFSISSALSMTLNGANGETFEAMEKALRLEGKSLQEINETYLKLMTEMVPVDDLVALEIANSVWIEKHITVKEPFMSALDTWYNAEARNINILDPEALNIVNGWIAEKTHDKITDMLDFLEPDLAMLLINAIYFNGKWRYQFDKVDTKDEPFYITPSTHKLVPMMHQEENLMCVRNGNTTLVDIPYGQGNFSMLAVLPDEGVSVSDVAQALNPTKWNEWKNLLEDNTRGVNLSMPRFKYGYKRSLKNDLINMGMGIAFTSSADFSNISTSNMMISRVEHQAFIETNEEGTEAAAATVVVMIDSMSGGVPITMTLNRPFLYFIHETSTGTILFMGRVGDPTVE